MSMSGAGAVMAPSAPPAIGISPTSRSRLFHRHSQMPPAAISPKAQPGIEGKRATAPFAEEME